MCRAKVRGKVKEIADSHRGDRLTDSPKTDINDFDSGAEKLYNIYINNSSSRLQ